MNNINADSNQPAYILHRRPYKESSLLLDVFTLNYGRFTLLAKGAKSIRPGKNTLIQPALLQPFQALNLSWKGRSQLKTLIQIEAPSPAIHLVSDRLYSGFYLNELVLRLSPELDASPMLFASYSKALVELSEDPDIERVLREFEFQLFQILGISPDFACEGGSLKAIQPSAYYRWQPDIGFVYHCAFNEMGTSHNELLLGEHLLAIGQGYFYQASSEGLSLASPVVVDKEIKRSAKRLNRRIIEHALQGKPLKSRELIIQLKGEKYK